MIEGKNSDAKKELLNTGYKITKKSMDESYGILKEHCPIIIGAIEGKDLLLKEAAESVLCWNVFNDSSGDIESLVRGLCDIEPKPINKIKSAETRFIEIRRLIIKARGNTDLKNISNKTLEKYAPNIMLSLNDKIEHKVKKIAQQELSKYLFGHKTADINFIKTYIQENIEANEGDIKEAIKLAELDFIEKESLISSLLSEFKEKEERSIIQSIQLGIAKYNILFVFLLIVALALSAQYLDQEALPLVSAAIGAASAHLLAERNTVLNEKKKEQSDKQEDS